MEGRGGEMGEGAASLQSYPPSLGIEVVGLRNVDFATAQPQHVYQDAHFAASLPPISGPRLQYALSLFVPMLQEIIVDSTLLEKPGKEPGRKGGSTLVLACALREGILFGNLGDSGALLRIPGEPMPRYSLSPHVPGVDPEFTAGVKLEYHKSLKKRIPALLTDIRSVMSVSAETEYKDGFCDVTLEFSRAHEIDSAQKFALLRRIRERIETLGPHVSMRTLAGLEPCRSLGDTQDPDLGRVPSFAWIPLKLRAGKTAEVILATDGLFDMVSAELVCGHLNCCSAAGGSGIQQLSEKATKEWGARYPESDDIKILKMSVAADSPPRIAGVLDGHSPFGHAVSFFGALVFEVIFEKALALVLAASADEPVDALCKALQDCVPDLRARIDCWSQEILKDLEICQPDVSRRISDYETSHSLVSQWIIALLIKIQNLPTVVAALEREQAAAEIPGALPAAHLPVQGAFAGAETVMVKGPQPAAMEPRL